MNDSSTHVRRCLLLLVCSLFLIHPFLLPPAAAQVPPPDVRLGAVEAFRDPLAAAEAGVGWERILMYWSELQPNGPDDWNGFHVPEDWLNQAASAGRQVVGLLKHTPAWATDGEAGCGVPRGLDLPVGDPNNLWAAFVRRAVGLYAGRIDHWIIWNEPDIAVGTYGVEWCGSVHDYYRLLQVAYLAAHEVNPNVTIHLAGLTYWHDRTYLRDFLAVATQDPTGAEHGYYFDVVSLHIYFQTDSVPYVINETRAALNAYGVQKPIWLNETNASPDADPDWPLVRPAWRVDLREQASFLLQSFALSLASGVQRVAVYKWVDAGLPPGGEPFGVIRPDFSRRPAYDAFEVITTYYAGVHSGSIDRQPLFYQVTLQREGQTIRVLWARTASSVIVHPPAMTGEGLLVSQTGETQPVHPQDGVYTLELPGARCADALGCIIGGPTYLLIEHAAGDPGATGAGSVTEGEGAPEGTDPPLQGSETITTTATATLAPTPEPTATPTETPAPTATHTPSPTPAPTATPTATPTPLPTPTSTPTPTPTPRSPFSAVLGGEGMPALTWLLLGGALVGLVAVVLARRR